MDRRRSRSRYEEAQAMRIPNPLDTRTYWSLPDEERASVRRHFERFVDPETFDRTTYIEIEGDRLRLTVLCLDSKGEPGRAHTIDGCARPDAEERWEPRTVCTEILDR